MTTEAIVFKIYKRLMVHLSWGFISPLIQLRSNLISHKTLIFQILRRNLKKIWWSYRMIAWAMQNKKEILSMPILRRRWSKTKKSREFWDLSHLRYRTSPKKLMVVNLLSIHLSNHLKWWMHNRQEKTNRPSFSRWSTSNSNRISSSLVSPKFCLIKTKIHWCARSRCCSNSESKIRGHKSNKTANRVNSSKMP